ncbi:MAG: ferric reductase-like transmembrane domain-containing protein [Azoarcus sp.]|jgi:predicted ferric reductase|nr:ferric reductase-like transmembrane domain-containing protein [Azoarcus sp.]
MKKIKWTYAVLAVGLTLLWLFAEQPWAQTYDFRGARSAIINFTGILAMGAMSVGMVLALRPVSIEPWLGGLDKSYRLHKWLGISALVVSIVHWLWAKVPKWLALGGPRPQRGGGGAMQQVDLGVFESFARQMHGSAETIGEWTFYVAAVLMIIALIKRFPYKHFFTTHRLLAIAYLLFVFHSVVLMKIGYWSTPIGWVMALLLVGGTFGALASLFRGIGHHRRVLGVVEALQRNDANAVVRLDIRLSQDRWDGHAAGQFAFVKFDDGEQAHPYTISSAWKKDGRLSFHVKELGDYTNVLAQTVKPGARATVEGPYGCFRFESDKPRQIWVAGGIGITPFMARMEELSQAGKTKQAVDLFYSAKSPDESSLAHLRQFAEASGVTLHVVDSDRDGFFDAAKLRAAVPQWQDASLWFCGPAGFGQALKKGLVAAGYDAEHFHQELFDMR